MVGGIETAGVALALLPLLINQLDNYVLGLETLKTFRAKRYRREIDGYRSNLGSQYAIFINTLEQAADGVADDGLSDWITTPGSDFWKNKNTQARFERRLGRNYVPFTRTVNELSTLLKELSEKLGFGETSQDTPEIDSSALELEVQKFRHIFSKSIYEKLFNQIDRANSILKTLVEQSHYQERATKNRDLKQRLQRHKVARKLANSLHGAIIHGSCWRCQCRNQHCVWFILDSSLTLGQEMSTKCPSRFRMVLGLKSEGDHSEVSSHWYEIEAESALLQTTQTLCQSSQVDSTPQKPITGKRKGKAPISAVTGLGESTMAAKVQNSHAARVPPIVDFCSTLCTIGIGHDQRKLLGCVLDDRHRHHIYLVRNIAERIQSETLYELIATSSTSLRDLSNGIRVFGRRDRLKLAVNLACSVLQFHGSWLANQWRTRDIMCSKTSSIQFSYPYIVWGIGKAGQQDADKIPSALIRNEVVFPLGLVLVELSLCENLEALQAQEDDDRVPAVMNLKTAARFLPAVEMESGLMYRKVVERCLFWPGTTENTTLENDKMHDEVFQLIIAPLIDSLRAFEGEQVL